MEKKKSTQHQTLWKSITSRTENTDRHEIRAELLHIKWRKILSVHCHRRMHTYLLQRNLQWAQYLQLKRLLTKLIKVFPFPIREVQTDNRTEWTTALIVMIIRDFTEKCKCTVLKMAESSLQDTIRNRTISQSMTKLMNSEWSS